MNEVLLVTALTAHSQSAESFTSNYLFAMAIEQQDRGRARPELASKDQIILVGLGCSCPSFDGRSGDPASPRYTGTIYQG